MDLLFAMARLPTTTGLRVTAMEMTNGLIPIIIILFEFKANKNFHFSEVSMNLLKRK